MNVSYNWIKTFFDKPLPQPKELAEILTMHSFENESLEKKGQDYILGIDVLPDRAGDCLSHIGIAKECAAILDKKILIPKINLKENKKLKTKDFVSVEVKDKIGCKRYIARVLTNVKITESPKWIKERLIACGLNPINNVVDITNYVMLEMGQPLHAFDYEKIQDQKIIVRKAKKGEKITTLSGLEYKLDEDILVIADSKNPLALAGIKGGQKSEINSKTKTIVLESANFNAKLISQTARKINLRTDASIRFEQNLDPNLAELAINRVAMLINEIVGADVASGLVDFYPNKLKPKKITLNLDNLNNILGLTIPLKEIENILKRLDIKLIKKTKNSLLLEIPTSRQDIIIPENLIEEIGRIYGYEKIQPELPCGYLAPVEKNKDIFWQNKAKNILKQLNYNEVYDYSFVDEDLLKLNEIATNTLRKVKNPVSSEFAYLRNGLMPQLLRDAKENLKTFKDFKIFELDKIFIPQKNKTLETRMLAGIIATSEEKAQIIFSKIRGELNLLINNLGIEKVSYEKGILETTWDKQNSLIIKIKGQPIGVFGQINFNILEKFNINERIFGFEIDFEKLQSLSSEKKEFESISFHPPATRDISGLVLKTIAIDAIIEEIYKIDIHLIKSAEPFDIYQGSGIPENQKSVSFHIVYQSDEKTLDTKTIDMLQKQILEKLEEKFNWQIRN